MMTLSGFAIGQSPANQKISTTTHNNPARAQASSAGNVGNAANGTSPKIRNAIHETGQQGHATINQQIGNPAPINNGNGNRKICRTIGSTAYYCL